jgi:hypothetical protein
MSIPFVYEITAGRSTNLPGAVTLSIGAQGLAQQFFHRPCRWEAETGFSGESVMPKGPHKTVPCLYLHRHIGVEPIYKAHTADPRESVVEHVWYRWLSCLRVIFATHAYTC